MAEKIISEKGRVMNDNVNVPRDPTCAMVDAGMSICDFAADVYRAMLAAAPKAEPASDLPPISLDGPHLPNDHRVWLARQLLDSKNDDATAYGIAAFHPAISDLWKKSKTFKAIKPEAPKVEQEPCGTVAIIPRKPTEKEISEIRYNINRKRSDGSDITECDVREVIDNYFYNVGKPHPAPASDELPDELDLFRIIRDAGRTDAEKARAVHQAIAKHKGPQS